MNDRSDAQLFFKVAAQRGAAAGRTGKERPREEGGEEEACPAFGYLRGIASRALAVEFRFFDGNSDWFAYSHLASWRHNPSVGLLLRFSGDVITMVLIRGSNMDALIGQGPVSLTDGLQRHRILWVREMDEVELRQVAENGPTIDRVDIAEFESQKEVQEWLKTVAPEFLRYSESKPARHAP